MSGHTYYNENDPVAAAWLRELIQEGCIAPGEVDERSITEVAPSDLAGFVQCHFFAGIGGWSYALRLAGWGDDRPAWTGSCPCQPFSAAGKGDGGEDPRHLWPAWFRLIQECRPGVLFGEQVEAAIGHGWFDLVSDDLEGKGYAIGSCVLPAASVGAPHPRHRLWFVAENDTHAERDGTPLQLQREYPRMGWVGEPLPWDRDWECALREFRAVDDGLSYGVEMCNGPRNAIVPQTAAAFIQAYREVRGDT